MGVFYFAAKCLEGFIECIILLPFKLVICEEERQREQYKGVREVVETASDKMSAPPELNPGD